jgi:hypothetical protein
MHSVAAAPSATTAQYAVPKRFGMAGILAITTLMAVLFGLLRYCNAHPAVYIFVGLLALVTCLVQMRYGEVPRIASILAGAIFMPVCVLATFLVALAVDNRVDLDDIGWIICISPMLAAIGAFFGYLSGACTAGLFLLMDLIEPYLPGGGASGPRYARPPAPPRDDIVTATLVPKDEQKHDPAVIHAMLADNPFVPQPLDSLEGAPEPLDKPQTTEPKDV